MHSSSPTYPISWRPNCLPARDPTPSARSANRTRDRAKPRPLGTRGLPSLPRPPRRRRRHRCDLQTRARDPRQRTIPEPVRTRAHASLLRRTATAAATARRRRAKTTSGGSTPSNGSAPDRRRSTRAENSHSPAGEPRPLPPFRGAPHAARTTGRARRRTRSNQPRSRRSPLPQHEHDRKPSHPHLRQARVRSRTELARIVAHAETDSAATHESRDVAVLRVVSH
jgi:hypothetical protein